MAMSQRMWKREQERKRRERIRRAKRRRNCAIAVVVLAVIAVLVIVAKMGNDDSGNKTLTQTTTAEVTNISIAANPYTTTREISDIDTEFFNDSAFAGNALAQTIGMYGILNKADFYAGVNVDVENVYTITTSGSTTPIANQFNSKSFSKIFLSFGEKELSNLTSSEFKSSYKDLVEKIKENQPNAKIYLIGIPPITADASNSGNGKLTMQAINEYNKRIMAIAAEESLYYVDSIDALGDNKDFLPNGVSIDGVNLNKAAVIDLLYYMANESYIPTAQDIADMDTDDDEEKATETATPTPKPEKTQEPQKTQATDKTQEPQNTQAVSPSPTVNVLKSSVSSKQKEE